MYDANSYDISSALTSLTTASCNDGYGLPIPPARAFVSESATSSGLNPGEANTGTETTGFADNNVPNTTTAGQSAWVQNMLCVLNSAGIQKLAYWALYDPFTLWSGSPWYYDAEELSSTFWGLAFEPEASGFKPSWSVLQQYYENGTLSCSSPSQDQPIIALVPGSKTAPEPVAPGSPGLQTPQFTINQPIRIGWNAAEVASFTYFWTYMSGFPDELVQLPKSATYACDYSDFLGTELGPGLTVASCAVTDVGLDAFTSTGSYNIYLGGVSVGGLGASGTTAVPVQIVSSPGVTSALGYNGTTYSSTILPGNYIVLYGYGFSQTGGNTVKFQPTNGGNGGNTLVLTDGSGLSWDQANVQINISPNSAFTAGTTWNVTVNNSYSPTYSASFPVTIQ